MRPPGRATLTPLAVAAALLSLVPAGCRPPAPPAGRERLTVEPAVRVALGVALERTTLSADGPFEIAGSAGDVVVRGAPGSRWAVTADSGGRLTLLELEGTGRAGPLPGPLVLRPRAGAAVVADGRRYRGEALVRAGPPGRVTVVNVLELEAYLRGVVPAEIGHRTRAELEAVKAQAVAARTYAVGRLGRATDFDLYAGTRDQVYAGLAGEDSLGNLAVAQTRGQIVTYRGQPIMAYYHSTCGGRTASIQGAWPWRPPQPYLRSVSDEKPGGGAYCDIAPRYRWRTTWTLAQLRDALTNALAALSGGAVREVQDIEELRILSRTPSGRVGSLRLRVDGTSYLLRGDSVRYVLRTPAGALLNSALLLEMTTHAPDDSLALEVEGGGWGHGVGMCQWGAIGRARAGQRYDRILATYYQGTQLTRLY